MFNKTKYKIVEVPANTKRVGPLESAQMKEGLHSLDSNPFFRYLCDRLRLQQLALESNLKGVRHKEVEDVHFIQSGIFWTGWLSQEIARLTSAPPKPEMAPLQQEEEAFNEIDRLLARVGIDGPQAE